jgi:dipeptidyl aminopeptidase/acylaminoacyl peptidase
MAEVSRGARPMTLEEVGAGSPGLGRVELAPDGVSFLCEYQGALWRIDREGRRERITEGRTPRRRAGGGAFAFLRGDPPQIWTRDAAGQERRRTDCPRGVTEYAWSADGTALVLLSPGEPSSQQDVSPSIVEIHRPRLEPGEALSLLALEGEEARLIAAAPPGVSWSSPALSPDGRYVAVMSLGARGMPERVLIIDRSNGESHPLLSTALRPCMKPHWSPDGGRLAFLYSPHDYAYPLQCQCAVVEVVGGRAVGDPVCLGEGYYLEESEDLCWHPDGQTIFAIGQHGASRHVLRIDLARQEVTQLTDEMGWHVSLCLSESAEWLACAFTAPSCRSALHLIPVAGGPCQVVVDLTAEHMGEIQLADAELVRWRAEDGMELEGVLVKPLGYRTGQRYPLVVDLHGGPAPGATARWVSVWHWLAGQGYAVFSPDFRGGQTYRWCDPPSVEHDFADTMSGVDHLIEAGLADPDRLGVYGFSYGADLLAWVLGHSTRFRAAVLASGGGDPRVCYGLLPGGNDMIARQYGGRPWEAPEVYHHQSPLTHLPRATTPTLLVTGDTDLVHIKLLYAWLRQAGVDVEAVHYRGEAHGIAQPSHRMDHMARMLAWFAKHLNA